MQNVSVLIGYFCERDEYIIFEKMLITSSVKCKVRGVIKNSVDFLCCIKYIRDIDLKFLHCLEELRTKNTEKFMLVPSFIITKFNFT
jgi:hypothetical protein